MKKLRVVYNVCGISGRENPSYWAAVIKSVYDQQFNDFDVVLSACYVDEEQLLALKQQFPRLIIVAVNDVVPVNVSFNLALQKSNELAGPAEGYLYLDYGIILFDPTVLSRMYTLFKSGPYGMVSTRTNNDNGYHLWFGLGKFHGDESENDRLFDNGDFIVPIGKCVNLHAQIFSHDLYVAYSHKVMPDIFAAYCTESVFTFLNAAIRRQWIISKDIILHHEQIPMNGASGFGNGVDGLDRMFIDQTPVLERIKPGIPFGMGYDESRGLVMHDESQYDEYGFCKNDDLRPYIRDYLFLSDEIFPYSKVNVECIN